MEVNKSSTKKIAELKLESYRLVGNSQYKDYIK